jgi:hypothetical protein
MAGRLTRFLNLERPHRPGEAPPHEVLTRARFSGEPSGIALEPDLGGQPFLRCPRCEADNSRYAERCHNCQLSMGGEDVRAWNERFWSERKAGEQSAAGPTRTEDSLLRQNRMLGEALAREIGARERTRLSWWSGADDLTPVGFRLLSLLPTTRARVLAGTVAFGTFLAAGVTALMARKYPLLQGAGFVIGLLLLVLFTPNARYRRWWD